MGNKFDSLLQFTVTYYQYAVGRLLLLMTPMHYLRWPCSISVTYDPVINISVINTHSIGSHY